MRVDPNIIDDYIKAIDFINFQDFCDRLLIKLYPNDYTPVRAGGRNGDMKNDGYCVHSRIFFQAHATRGESAKKTKDKIEKDLKGCIENWGDIQKFVYITNDTLIGEIENHIDVLRKKYSNIKIETWSNKIITSKLKELSIRDLEYVMDRKIHSELNILDSELLSAKYLITKEFSFIKEICQGDLSSFPFENPLLLENHTLAFIRKLTKSQEYRSDTLEKTLHIKEEEYLNFYPDSIEMPYVRGEYRFLYHERYPHKHEIKSILKSDNISQFLLNNGVSVKRICKINTCYEGECSGEGNFQELFLLRPLYMQFLIIKNISSKPVLVESIDSLIADNVLYNLNTNELQSEIINLPKFKILPNQNVIIPIGVFLSEFEEIKYDEQLIITSKYQTGQFQQLNFGKLKQSPIEYLGPSLIPKRIKITQNEVQRNIKIHDFSFNNVYWIDRFWQCGSCPHLFFIQGGSLQYQGEIFDDLPNILCLEKITIPYDVSQIIIAELEHETTLIESIVQNDEVIVQNIVLTQNNYYLLNVCASDVLHIKGKYMLQADKLNKLPTYAKKNLIDQFKITFIKNQFMH